MMAGVGWGGIGAHYCASDQGSLIPSDTSSCNISPHSLLLLASEAQYVQGEVKYMFKTAWYVIVMECILVSCLYGRK